MNQTPYLYTLQKHHAKNLHYDLRLSDGKVLKSWVVPKNLPSKAGIKRLAIQVEDHKLGYARFEGKIPEGQYGAGEVFLEDEGEYYLITQNEEGRALTMAQALKAGRIEIKLCGKKFKGQYALIQMEDRNWLIFKMKKK